MKWLALLAAVALTGCGGGGSAPMSPLAGSYVGSFVHQSGILSGTADATISPAGGLVIHMHFTVPLPMEGVITGTISNAGAVTATYHVSSGDGGTTGGSLTPSGPNLDGTLSFSGNIGAVNDFTFLKV